eukprot:TRINITY_DN4413_c0_g1_i1.p1 TRINITY_DN4413_c0_g1~~TRINITY_DN4413_c0_g1_i1.p1  ORF type:complete len:131 (+),score=7.99 TRINITY_DN4413_c0_g1_i1:296-688(+)
MSFHLAVLYNVLLNWVLTCSRGSGCISVWFGGGLCRRWSNWWSLTLCLLHRLLEEQMSIFNGVSHGMHWRLHACRVSDQPVESPFQITVEQIPELCFLEGLCDLILPALLICSVQLDHFCCGFLNEFIAG